MQLKTRVCVLWFLLYIITSVYHYYRWKLFLCIMNGSQKRSHVSANKKSREEIDSPVRRMLGFQERASPAQKVLIICSSCVLQWKYVVSYITSIKVLIYRSKINEYRCLKFQQFVFFPCRQASRRILQKARLVRSPKSPKQLPSTSKRAFPWQRKEQVALVQFVALFEDLKKDGSEWPTTRHDYWNKAAAFVLQGLGCEDLVSLKVDVYQW